MARKIRSARGAKGKIKANVAQKHITRRIGTHQRAAQKRKEAQKGTTSRKGE